MDSRKKGREKKNLRLDNGYLIKQFLDKEKQNKDEGEWTQIKSLKIHTNDGWLKRKKERKKERKESFFRKTKKERNLIHRDLLIRSISFSLPSSRNTRSYLKTKWGKYCSLLKLTLTVHWRKKKLKYYDDGQWKQRSLFELLLIFICLQF